MSSEFDEITAALRSMSSEHDRQGMARFGINVERALGVSVYELRRMARAYRRNHELAIELWDSGIHECRLMAAFVDDFRRVTEQQMEEWVADFDSWDVCDQVCSNLFDKTPWAWNKAIEWTEREKEFVKRAGFVMMACLAVHDKEADDERFEVFFPLLVREAGDDRNFVKKAVNWALRQMGKRSRTLNARAIEVAEQIQQLDARSARWIASDAARELTSDKVQDRLGKHD